MKTFKNRKYDGTSIFAKCEDGADFIFLANQGDMKASRVATLIVGCAAEMVPDILKLIRPTLMLQTWKDVFWTLEQAGLLGPKLNELNLLDRDQDVKQRVSLLTGLCAAVANGTITQEEFNETTKTPPDFEKWEQLLSKSAEKSKSNLLASGELPVEVKELLGSLLGGVTEVFVKHGHDDKDAKTSIRRGAKPAAAAAD